MDPPRPEGGPGPGKQQLMCQPSGLTEKPGKTRGFGVEYRRGTRMVLLRLDHITPIGGGRPWRKGSVRTGGDRDQYARTVGLMEAVVAAVTGRRFVRTADSAPVVSTAGGATRVVRCEVGGMRCGEC